MKSKHRVCPHTLPYLLSHNASALVKAAQRDSGAQLVSLRVNERLKLLKLSFFTQTAFDLQMKLTLSMFFELHSRY